MSRQTVLAALLAVAALSLVGCSSCGGHGTCATQPPFPIDPDPCAAYCLVWVPETYREVPSVVQCTTGCCTGEAVYAKHIDFCETCKPCQYEQRCRPDVCREYGIVEVNPEHTEWESVECCPTPSVCGKPCCYRPVKKPATYQVCKKTETEQGIEYCAYTPPQYDIVQQTSVVGTCWPRYTPPEYRVQYHREVFQEGHYAWVKRDCGCAPARTEPPKCVCAPQPVIGCGPCGVAAQPASCAPRVIPRKGSFTSAPAAD